MLLAEAGTGIGKTLAYLAPASLWAEASGGTVWVSTFTKALQRQLDAEGPRLFADPAERAQARSSSARAARIICACSTSRMRCRARSPGAPRSSRIWSGAGRPIRRDGDMVGGDLPGWLPSLFRRAGRDRADRPPRRMRLCRLPALPPLLHRARRARRARGRHRHRQPCLGDGQRRARAARARRRGSCSTRAIICSTPPIRPSRSRSAGRKRSRCGAGSSAPKAARAGRRRGLAARLMDVASYDEEGGQALEAAIEAARALPSDGWLQRVAEGDPFGAGRGAARRGARHGLRAGQGAGGGLRARRPSWPSRTARWSPPPRRRWRRSKRCRSRWRRWRGGWRRCSRMRPTGSTRRRGRGSKARSAGSPGGARRWPRGSPCSAGSAARPTPNFVDWLAIERGRGPRI